MLYNTNRCPKRVKKCGIDGNIDVSKKHIGVNINDLKNRNQPHGVPTIFSGIERINF